MRSYASIYNFRFNILTIRFDSFGIAEMSKIVTTNFVNEIHVCILANTRSTNEISVDMTRV